MDILCPLLGLVLGLFLLAAIGHGIWVLFARLFGGSQAPSASTDLGAASGDSLHALRITRAEIERLHRIGLLDQASCRKALDAIGQQEDEILRLRMGVKSESVHVPVAAPQPIVPPEPAPVAAPPTPPVEPRSPLIRPAEPFDAEVKPVLPRKLVPPQPVVQEPPPEPVAPRPPRRPLSAVLTAFMEERNIRWGELVGGMLIVLCSTALVVSLWSQIAAIPVLKFFIFTAVTASLFGVGLYTEHRWKLPTTSRGVLITATLLVPLTFLAIAAFSEGTGGREWMAIPAELIAMVLFAALLYWAAKVVTPQWPVLVVVGVLGASASQLIIRRFSVAEMSDPMLLLLGAVPLGVYAGVVGVMAARCVRSAELDRKASNAVFALAGIATFATLMPLGLLLFKAGHFTETLQRLSLLVTLFGVPSAVTGGLLWSRMKQAELAGARTAGTSIGVAGALVLLLGVALAWPEPARLLPVLLLDFAVLAALGLLFEIAAAHLPAGLCTAGAWLLGIHLLAGRVGWHVESALQLIAVLLSARSGTALVPLVVLLLGACGLLARFDRRPHAIIYAGVAGIVAAVSVGLVTFYGLGRVEDQGATWVYLIYAAGAILAAALTRRSEASWVACGLLLLSLVQGVVYHFGPRWGITARQGWQIALLVHASLGAIVVVVANRLRVRGRLDCREVFAGSFGRIALPVSIAAIIPILGGLSVATSGTTAWHVLWLAAIWMVLAWESRLQPLVGAGQAALALAVALGVVSRISAMTWFVASEHPLADPRTLQAVGIGLAVLSLLWAGVRIVLRRAAVSAAEPAEGSVARARWLLEAPWACVDRVVTFAVLLVLVGLVIYGVTPGIAEEFAASPAASEVAFQSPWRLAPHALGGASWVLLGILLATLAASCLERCAPNCVLGVILALAAACPLLAGRYEGLAATASALRWYLAIYWVAASIVLWLREPLGRLAARLQRGEAGPETIRLDQLARALLLLTTVMPVLAITTYRVVLALAGHPAIGPVAGTLPARIGNMISYAVPLALLSAGLIGHALRERSAGYAFAGGLVINFTVTLARLMALVTAGEHIGSVELLEILQLNMIAAAVYAIAWQAERRWLRRIAVSSVGVLPLLLRVQRRLGLAGGVLLLVPATLRLLLHPESVVEEQVAVGSLFGWVAMALSVAAAWPSLATRDMLRPSGTSAVGLAIGSLIALTIARGDTGNWQGFHALLVACAIVAWVPLVFLARWGRAPSESSPCDATRMTTAAAAVRCANAGMLLAIALALRGVAGDPGRPWWSVGVLLGVGVLSGVLSRATLAEGHSYVSALVVNVAASVWWLTDWWQPEPRRATAAVLELVEVNIVALVLPALFSLVVLLRGRPWRRTVGGTFALHGVACVVSTVAVLACVAAGLVADAGGRPIDLRPLVGSLALAAAGVMAVACIWDLRIKPVAPVICLLGIAAVGMVVDRADLDPPWLRWYGAVLIAVYSLVVNSLWLSREAGLALSARLRLPDRRGLQPPAPVWLLPSNVVAAGSAIVLAYWTVLTFGADAAGRTAGVALGLRLAVAGALVVHVIAFGLLAQGLGRHAMRHATLHLGAAAAIAIGWALMEPGGVNDRAINRTVVLMVAMAATVSAYAFVLGKLRRGDTPWTQAGDAAVPWLLVAGLLSLCVILGTEIVEYASRREVPMSYPAILAVLLALLGLVAVALVFAVVPGRDPLKLPESRRTVYVYAAECLLALAFMHIRLTMPWLFTGFFERYWPLIVMAIAFLGVGLSELFRGQGRMVLAEPLERTGALLPVLPVLAFWALRGGSEVHYSVQLVLAGCVYAVLSARRHSFAYGLLAALAGNGGLWYMLHTLGGYGLLQHPQLWFIPAGLSVLTAAHLNRDRLDAGQMAAIRYASMAMIYLSSTFEIFLNGVREAPWLPLVLAGLSVAGVLAGIMLRIRSFLTLGSLFLLIALLTMIWHASANFGWTWLWYVAGIALGVMIIGLFALFEKRRSQMLQLVEDFKGWRA